MAQLIKIKNKYSLNINNLNEQKNLMKNYQRKQANVQAIQFNGTNHEEIIALTNGAIRYQSDIDGIQERRLLKVDGNEVDGNGERQNYQNLILVTQENVNTDKAWIRQEVITEGDFLVRSESGDLYFQRSRVFLNEHIEIM